MNIADDKKDEKRNTYQVIAVTVRITGREQQVKYRDHETHSSTRGTGEVLHVALKSQWEVEGQGQGSGWRGEAGYVQQP